MATNARPLKAYIRYDGNNRAISSSLIWRKKKPKVGKWREYTAAYLCCVFTTTTTTTAASTTTTTTAAPSDIRLKKTIYLTGGKVGQLSEYSWEWNDLAVSLGLGHYPTVGILAHEALDLYPEAVTFGNDGYLRVDYRKIV